MLLFDYYFFPIVLGLVERCQACHAFGARREESLWPAALLHRCPFQCSGCYPLRYYLISSHTPAAAAAAVEEYPKRRGFLSQAWSVWSMVFLHWDDEPESGQADNEAGTVGSVHLHCIQVQMGGAMAWALLLEDDVQLLDEEGMSLNRCCLCWCYCLHSHRCRCRYHDLSSTLTAHFASFYAAP